MFKDKFIILVLFFFFSSLRGFQAVAFSIGGRNILLFKRQASSHIPMDSEGERKIEERRKKRKIINLFKHLLIRVQLPSSKDVVTSQTGLTDLLYYEIELNCFSEYSYMPPHPLPEEMKDYIEKEIQEMIKKKIIEPVSQNNKVSLMYTQSSRAFIIKKCNGNFQKLWIDFRLLNCKIENEIKSPLSNTEYVLNVLKGSKIFTMIVLTKGHRQIGLTKQCRHLTTFSICFESDTKYYQFMRIPDELCSAASVLSVFLDHLFEDMKGDFVYNFGNIIVIFSQTYKKHMEHLDKVFQRLRHAKITVSPDDIQFCRKEISLLGNIISSDGSIKIDPARINAIQNLEPPKNAKGVKSVLNMANKYSSLIDGFENIIDPLRELCKCGMANDIQWQENHLQAFNTIKEKLISPPVLLQYPCFNSPFILQTDASRSGLGAVLCQVKDEIMRPVGFASRKLTKEELNKYKTPREKECLAMVFGLENFYPYLQYDGFVLQSDCSGLIGTISYERKLTKLVSLKNGVRIFSFRGLGRIELQHVGRGHNVVADALANMYC